MKLKRLFWTGVFGLLIGPTAYADPPVDPTPDTGNFIDRSHYFLSNLFYWPMAYTDQLFMEENATFEANPSYFRIIGNYTWVNREGFKFKPQFRAKVRLKALQRRLSLIAFGENENEASPDIDNKQKIERNTGNVGRDTTRTRVGFRYTILEWLDSDFDADVVVSDDLFPEPSLRFRQRLYKSELTRSRFTVTGFYKEDLKFGQTTRLDTLQKISTRWAYDAALTGRSSEVRPDLEWDTYFNLNYVLSSREGLALRLQAIGPTHPHTIVSNYRTSVVYRRNFYRSWMFYEVEPGVDWPYRDNHRAPVWSSAFRLELVFKSL